MGKPVPQAERMSGAGPRVFPSPTGPNYIQIAYLLQVVTTVEQGQASCKNRRRRPGTGGLVRTPPHSLATRELYHFADSEKEMG